MTTRNKKNARREKGEKKDLPGARLADKHRDAVADWLMRQYGELRKKQYGALVLRAVIDPNFKARLMADPQKVFRQFKIKPPKGLRVRVVENTPSTEYLVLPNLPSAEKQMKRVVLKQTQLSVLGDIRVLQDDWFKDPDVKGDNKDGGRKPADAPRFTNKRDAPRWNRHDHEFERDGDPPRRVKVQDPDHGPDLGFYGNDPDGDYRDGIF